MGCRTRGGLGRPGFVGVFGTRGDVFMDAGTRLNGVSFGMGSALWGFGLIDFGSLGWFHILCGGCKYKEHYTVASHCIICGSWKCDMR
jgi:hypothetical protein